MGTHPFGYITVILIQQLVIVGLFCGVARLLEEQRSLRSRLVRIRVVMGGADLSPARQEMASPELQELLFEPRIEQSAETDARVLAGVDA
jgi:hypothetical protein